MFCDLVGSTALSAELDPEDLRDVIAAYHTCVAEVIGRYDGSVAKYMGDGVLVYFGYPQAHEDDAERAVRSGLDLVPAVARLQPYEGRLRLQVRIGIATGLVIVGDLIGAGAAREEAVVGETPNLAARLQALAEPGQVIISHNTRQLVGEIFEVTDSGTHMLKGFAVPVRSWHVLRPSAVESRFDALHGTNLTPLIGREHELALLLERFERAKDGEGQVVLLSGEPGIGKSRLLRALRKQLAGESLMSLSHFCSPYHQHSALYPVIGRIERSAGLRRDESHETHLDKLEALLALGAENTREAAALIADLLAIPAGARFGPLNLTPQEKKEKTFQALLDQLSGLAARQPVLLLYEDIQWADASTIELLGLIIDCVQHLPVLVVVTFRPEFSSPWVGYAHATTLTLNRLTRRQGAAIVEKVAEGKPLPSEVAEQILARTDGVPLFVEELTRAVLEAGLLRDMGEHFELIGPLPPLAIPATLHDSLMARLDRLAALKEVAQVGAVIGRDFSHELLMAVAPFSEEFATTALTRLVAAELVFRRGVPPHATYTFKHALVQEAAYASLLKSRRQQLHARVASALQKQFPDDVAFQPELLARHFTEAGLMEEAITWWRRAGERASERSANVEEIAHLSRGLQLIEALPGTSDRAEDELAFRLQLGAALIATKGYAAPEVERTYVRARELCEQLGRSGELFLALRGLWNCYFLRGELIRVLALAERLVALANGQEELFHRASARRALGSTLFFLSQFSDAREHLDQGIALDEQAAATGNYGARILLYAERPGVVCRLYSAWAQWLLGFPDRALAASEAALALSNSLTHAHTLAFTLSLATVLHIWRHENEEALRKSEAAISISREHSIPQFLSFATMCRGIALARFGQHEDGLAALHGGFASWNDLGARLINTMWLGFFAEANAASGQLGGAFATLDRATETAAANSEYFYQAELHRLRGLVHQQRGESADAQHWLQAAVNLARSQAARSFELRAATDLARLWRDQRRHTDARDLLAPVYRNFSEGFSTLDLKQAKALLDELGE
jgi:predicted ATPase/class 3 adenylate cyclase